jgi:hypothetical protein
LCTRPSSRKQDLLSSSIWQFGRVPRPSPVLARAGSSPISNLDRQELACRVPHPRPGFAVERFSALVMTKPQSGRGICSCFQFGNSAVRQFDRVPHPRPGFGRRWEESTFPTDVGITHAVRISACRLATSKRALPAAFHPHSARRAAGFSPARSAGSATSFSNSVPPGTTGRSLDGTSSAQHTSRERIAFAPCHPEAAPAEGSHTCGHHRCRSDCFWWDSPGNQPHRGRDVFPGGTFANEE